MDKKTKNTVYLDYGIRRANNLLSPERDFDFAVQLDLTSVYKAIAALADWVGYETETLRPDPLDVDAERERMAELRKTIEGLKNGND